jgi:signal peptidase II
VSGPAATSRRPRWVLFFAVAALVVIVDQLSKAWLVGLLAPGERQSIIGDWLRIVHGQNDGAIFGLFRDQALLFGLVSVGVVALIIWYHGSSGRNTLMSIALGLLLGGAIGNMIDRFRLGYVTDWVDIGIGDWRFYTFNVADSAVTVAVLLLLLIAILPARTEATATTSGEATPPGPDVSAPPPRDDTATADPGTADV